MSSMGGEGFVDYLSSRDLNSWRAEIPRLSTSQDAHGKPCFVYVIEVNRGLMVGEEERDDNRQPNWAIHRQFHEFYVLESKLTEFHGEFEDVQLPARPGKMLFGGGVGGGVGGGGSHGLDVMQSRRGAFESYLAALLAKPSLKGSDILFTFLTSEGDFASSSNSPLLMSGLGLGKMMRSVPMKLSKERGQGLVPFISAFVTQTQPLPPKPRHDYVVGAKEFDITLERPIEHHPLFGNIVGLLPSQEQRPGHCSKFYRDYPTRKEGGVFDTLIYLAINVFKVSKGKIQVLLGLRILLRKSVDTLVEWAIATKLAEVLSVGRVAYICQILEGTYFPNLAV